MSYDKNGLGFAELMQVALYFPSVYAVIEDLIPARPEVAIAIARKTIDAFNVGMIETK